MTEREGEKEKKKEEEEGKQEKKRKDPIVQIKLVILFQAISMTREPHVNFFLRN